LNRLEENIKRIKGLMLIFESEREDVSNINKGEDDQDPVQVQGPDGMDDDSDNELEESLDGELSEEGEGETTDTKSAGAGASDGYPTLNIWTTNLARSKGNPIGVTKWKSGRTFGPTGNNYKDA
jgi:hypothetical protein